ncbi:MAG: dUTP diphosphatase [Phycisphaeraceae bacterium]|nr:dUTP diphosphatase [Phycisphaeraceae bacterium]
MPTLRIRKLDPGASIPCYQSELAAGLDLSAFVPDGELIIAPGRIAMIRTGIAVAVPVGFEAQVRPRSGLASKHGITLPNSPGTIDADYRGEVLVPLINLGREAFTVTHGLRIAQMVIAPVAHVKVEEVTELEMTARGVGGFGSTGV